jgi:hypothetical protein
MGNAIGGLYAVGGAAAGLCEDGDGTLTGIDTLAGLGLARLAALSLAPVADDA